MGELQKQIVCVHCGYVITTEADLTVDSTWQLPLHKDCSEKWLKLNELQKRIKKRLYELSEKIDESPSFYHGLDKAEVEFFEVIEEAKKDWPETIPEEMISKEEQEKPYSERKDYLQTAWVLYTKQREWFEKRFG